MSKDFEEQISTLYKSDWVNLSGLVDCATTRLSKPTCQSIQFLGNGSYNNVYKLSFTDGSEIAASVPVDDNEDFDAQGKLSEIATMRFVRTSGLYSDIIVPEVYAWDITFNNPVGAPYVLMDVIHGRKLNEIGDDAERVWGLSAMSEAQQLVVVKALAKLKSSLSAPTSFDEIGSITFDDEGGYIVGPLFNIMQSNLGGPYRSLTDLWRAQLDKDILFALKEWSRLETDHLSYNLSPQKFSELFQLLSSLIPHFTPPSSYMPLILHHPDLALRNVFFDPIDDSKIVGLIDWGGAQILPWMLTAEFPADLFSKGDDPCTREEIPDENWILVPYDWTSFGDTSKWPTVYRKPNEPLDLTVQASRMIKLYYLRQHFSMCFAQENHDRWGDYNPARSMLFAHAPYYLKFHEVITSGWSRWLDHAEWIRETYWRLNATNHDSQGGALIIGPNVYCNAVEKHVCDLGIFEKQSSENDEDSKGEDGGD